MISIQKKSIMKMQLRKSQTILLSAILLPVSEPLHPAVPGGVEASMNASTTNRASIPDKDSEGDDPAFDMEDALISLPGLATNDPFANSEAMRQRAIGTESSGPSVSALLDQSGLSVHGAVRDASGKELALIEIGRSGVHGVREGDVLSISSGGRSASITIVSIQRQSVEVEFGSFEDRIIIR